MKKFISIAVALVMAITCMSTKALALSDTEAVTYAQLINKLEATGPALSKTYLVDFDGDGSEELLAIFNVYTEDNNYEGTYRVYSGDRLLCEEKLGYHYIDICRLEGDSKSLYLHVSIDLGDDFGFDTYTVQNGQWVLYEDFSWGYDMDSDRNEYTFYYINDEKVSFEEYCRRKYMYTCYTDLLGVGTAKNTVAKKASDAKMDYPDANNKISNAEKKLMLDDCLYDIASAVGGYYDGNSGMFDPQYISDYDLMNFMANVKMDTDIPIEDTYTEADFDELTSNYFGRSFDYSCIAVDHQPTAEEICYNNTYYDGVIRLYFPQRGNNIGISADMFKNYHLYDLGNDKYYASFTMDFGINFEYSDKEYLVAGGGIVSKNADGSYRIVKAGFPMTEAEVKSAVEPSDWAKAEIADAEKKGLVPELYNNPEWKGYITRLQFAQLAVNMAEKVTGKKLPSAPEGTFKDCDNEAVLKAYKAGIVNGVSETEFDPYKVLTREQLATMLWRTVSYLQTSAKKEVLKAGGDISGYSDGYAVSDYAREAVSALAKNEIMKGTSATELSPKSSCSVEQSAILVYRTFNKLK